VGERPDRLGPVAYRDWQLWVDWCTAADRDPGEVTGADLAAFLADLPATAAIQNRRLRNIRRSVGLPPTGLPTPTTRVPARVGPPWLSYPDALAALRHEWFPEGVAARRDALILVLTAHGFTRRRIRCLQPHVVAAFPDFVVDGLPLPGHPNPAICARCAMTRWLAVLDAYRHRSGRDIEDLLTDAGTYPRPRHDCLDPLDNGWRTYSWLIPAIDQHGAITSGRPLTVRALTAILARRFTPSLTDLSPPTMTAPLAREPGRRPTHDEQDDLARLYDRINAEADALNVRIEAVLQGLR